ncbi:ABC transporter substrate-binding protein [Bacillus tuaregi]|uniref:ABC transporter substrate-binding protein n=1 Tax=Bacillus tuaregi TaxID=1816695 RepID=UPI0008F90662|nr:ABC transporter substrate-binding protein [Bacillus tuaregi]
MRKLLLILPVIVLLLITACGDRTENKVSQPSTTKEYTKLEKVQILLATKSTAMFYAFVAREKGFFEDEGLDVELVSNNGGASVVEQLGSETADIGIVAVASLFQAWNNGMDIQVVYQINSTNLFDFLVPKHSNITDISQLNGKAVGVTDPGGAEVPMVRAILSGAGLEADQDVMIRAIGNDAETISAAFENGEIDAFSGGAHDLIALKATDFKSKSLLPREYKTLPSTAIIANGKIIKERPELIERISRAVARGVDYSINNRHVAYDIMSTAFPEEYTVEHVGKMTLDTFINLSTPIESEKGYGYIYHESWEKLIEQFSIGENPVVTNNIDLNKYLNSSFLEKANQFE